MFVFSPFSIVRMLVKFVFKLVEVFQLARTDAGKLTKELVLFENKLLLELLVFFDMKLFIR